MTTSADTWRACTDRRIIRHIHSQTTHTIAHAPIDDGSIDKIRTTS
jgi:hypothetical protein